MATVSEAETQGEDVLFPRKDAAEWMKGALEMAKHALAHGEVPVGCVVVWKGRIIARGCNEVNATLNASRHAEMVALDAMMKYCADCGLTFKDVCKNSVLYVTVEPCIMCSFALRLTNLVHVVFGCNNERFGGCGSVMNTHSVKVGSPRDDIASNDGEQASLPSLETTCGILKEEAIRLLQQFYEEENPHAPQEKVKIKKITTKD